MGLNISETSGDSHATTNNNQDGWTYDVDLTDPGVTVVTGDFDQTSNFTGDPSGEVQDGYEFSDLSTDDYGTLTYDEGDGTFTFTIDKQAVYQSGSSQTVTFSVTGYSGANIDDDLVIINLLICVARGTLVETDQGEVRVEDLRPGDRVWTRDGGYQPVRWIGSRKLGTAELKANPGLRPVVIRRGALGPGRPWRDLTVSPQHKILIDDWRAQMLFGEDEILAPARGMVDDLGILVDHSCRPVEYIHVLFDTHQIIRTNGAETESFRPGAVTMDEMDREARAELLQVMPALRGNGDGYGPTARYAVSVQEARAMAKGGRDAA